MTAACAAAPAGARSRGRRRRRQAEAPEGAAGRRSRPAIPNLSQLAPATLRATSLAPRDVGGDATPRPRPGREPGPRVRAAGRGRGGAAGRGGPCRLGFPPPDRSRVQVQVFLSGRTSRRDALAPRFTQSVKGPGSPGSRWTSAGACSRRCSSAPASSRAAGPTRSPPTGRGQSPPGISARCFCSLHAQSVKGPGWRRREGKRSEAWGARRRWSRRRDGVSRA